MMGEPRRVVLVFASVRSVGDAEGACFFPNSFMVRSLDLHGVDICAIGCSLFLPFVSLSSSSVLSISPFPHFFSFTCCANRRERGVKLVLLFLKI